MDWKSMVPIVVRWVLKFAGGFLASIGVSQSSAEEVAIGVALFVVGAVISLINRKKDIATPPPGA